jgi:hypothetical protein
MLVLWYLGDQYFFVEMTKAFQESTPHSAIGECQKSSLSKNCFDSGSSDEVRNEKSR